jgi:hypothetical protein
MDYFLKFNPLQKKCFHLLSNCLVKSITCPQAPRNLATLPLSCCFSMRRPNLNSSNETPRSKDHYLFILPYDSFVPSSKLSSPQRAIWCFLFQFPVPYPFLKVIQSLLTSSSLSYRHYRPSFCLSFKIVIS